MTRTEQMQENESPSCQFIMLHHYRQMGLTSRAEQCRRNLMDLGYRVELLEKRCDEEPSGFEEEAAR